MEMTIVRWILLMFCVRGTITTRKLQAQVTQLTITPTTVHENDTLVISCTIVGFPAPTYSILNNATNTVLVSGVAAGTVNATKVAGCRDTAVWVCTATNDPATEVNSTMTANATVYCAPRPSQPPRYLFKTGVGQNAVLLMKYIATPAPNVTWTHNNTIVPIEKEGQGERVQFAYTNSVPHGVTMLYVAFMTMEDFGNYTLTLDNGIATFVADYRITAFGPPATPQLIDVRDITSDSATVRWLSGFDHGAPQHFWVDVWRQDSQTILRSDYIFDHSDTNGVNQTWHCTMMWLERDTEYTWTVYAQNPFYRPVISTHGHFKTLLIDHDVIYTSPKTSVNTAKANTGKPWFLLAASTASLLWFRITLPNV